MTKAAKRTAMKISPQAVGAPRTADDGLAQVYVVPEPAPGVVPAGAPRLANDDILTGLYGYAGGYANQFTPGISGSGTGFYAFLGYPYLAALLQQSEYRRGVETLAREMTRKWIKLTYAGNKKNAKKLAQLEKAMRRFKVREVFRRAAELDGGFGRGHIYLDTGASVEDRSKPLVIDSRVLKKGCLKAIRTVEPIWCNPQAYNATDPLAKDFYKPPLWYVMGQSVSATRLLTLVGREVPDILKAAYLFGGVSLVQMAKPTVDNFTGNRESVSRMLRSFSTMVLETDLSSALNGGNGSDVAARATMYNNYRDNSGLLMTNAEGSGVAEKLYNVSAPLSTLDHLLAQSQEQMAAIYGTPLVVLFGITPSGLNATADGEIRVFYDFIHAYQEHLFNDPLSTVMDVIQLHEFGEIDPAIGFEYEPLWELDEAAQAAIEKTKAETHEIYANSIGAVDPTDVRESISTDERSPYAQLDLSGPAPGPPAMGEMDSDGEEDDDKLPAGGEAKSGV